jgi:hypothetical protein
MFNTTPSHSAARHPRSPRTHDADRQRRDADVTAATPASRASKQRRPPARPRRSTPALALGATLAALAISAPAALADPSCRPSGTDTVCTFAKPGTATWTVPPGVTGLQLDVFGAQGGGFFDGGRGAGTTWIPVTGGEALQVNVGGAGGFGASESSGGAGGFNGGAPGGGADSYGWSGSGGGGASDVRSGSFTLADRIIVAGGGGGSGGRNYASGGDGNSFNGDVGANGDTAFGDGYGGGGGTHWGAGGGGAGGSIGASVYGEAGAAGGFGPGGRGGDGIAFTSGAGGGGGGGYYGGGGGGGGWTKGGGGGGGGGFGSWGSDTNFLGGDGQVWITYTTPEANPPVTTITLSPAGANGEDGWYTRAVHATVAASDAAGGSSVNETRCTIDPPSAPATFDDLPASACPYLGAGADVTSDGQHTLYAASKDAAGNKETPRSAGFKIDQTPPTVTCTGTPAFRLNQAGAAVSATVTDGTSKPAQSPVSANADTASVGTQSVTLTGTDTAGNQATAACSYLVTYAFAGFPQPVDNLDADGHPVLNVAKGGQAIPLTWRLTDDNGIPVTSLTSAQITVVGISCSLDTTLDQLEEVAAGGSGLQNLGNGNYQLNWKSPTSYASSCKRLRLDLSEGSTTSPTYHTADFKFTK